MRTGSQETHTQVTGQGWSRGDCVHSGLRFNARQEGGGKATEAGSPPQLLPRKAEKQKNSSGSAGVAKSRCDDEFKRGVTKGLQVGGLCKTSSCKMGLGERRIGEQDVQRLASFLCVFRGHCS